MSELSKQFDFKKVEDIWLKSWEENSVFHAEADPKKKPYAIVIPPPNVTGILHMGHALNNTLQDITIRYNRMKGREALWMPGTDHAGIATQNVVEKDLAREGKNRQDIGRDAFLERLWSWKKEYGDTIIHQLKKLGSSCDWQRTRFTMDDEYSHAVRHTFVSLYEKGLIYRGEYIINWCPRCHTALSDEEAEHRDTQGHLYHIRYPLKDDESQYVVVATTRPETMLGDTAVAVNPKDKRYKSLIGKTLILPILKREIPIIKDSFVDPKFGTGAVKVTPAHDPNDFDMGKRHDLPFINIMHPDARLNENAGDFNNMDRFKAREAIVKTLKKNKCLEKIEPHDHAVGHCYRCHTVVEPYLSKQWFVKMKPLAAPAVKVVKDGKVKFHPQRWRKVYLNWMENIRDWCISRQIWWGHRIPVWYCVGDGACQLKCKDPIVSMDAPKKCPHCGSSNLRQDEDVLDTWFSSWLWPFATLGWPQEEKDLKYFYPTASLFTAPEIIFFWVARMIMAGLEFMDEIPFSDVYLHGTVRDAKGRKMSKSLGNALDPLEIINEYGADALRFSLIINSGQDILISKEKFEIGRNFANKIWNASRLILMNVPENHADLSLSKIKDVKKLALHHQWILSKYYSTVNKVEKSINSFRFSEAESLIYDFFWGNFCDWYLEIIKEEWDNPDVQTVALEVLKLSLKLMHPFMPFVTEELWKTLEEGSNPLCHQPWPLIEKSFIDKKIEKKMSLILEGISAVRNLRAQWNIKNKEKIDLFIISSSKNDLNNLSEAKPMIALLAKIDQITFDTSLPKRKNMATAVVKNIKFVIPLGGVIDLEKEKSRLASQLEEQKKATGNLSKRLKNKSFLNKAPLEIVEKEKVRLKGLEEKIEELKTVLQHLA